MKSELKIEERIVAFIDILGFQEKIVQFDKDKDYELLYTLTEAMDVAINAILKSPDDSEDFAEWKNCVDVKLFSDCLCVSIPKSHETISTVSHLKVFFQCLSSYQLYLMKKGILTRGGVSVGSYYSDDNLIFSGALVNAVKIEKKTVYPRIEVDKSFLDIIEPCHDKNFFDFNLMFSKDIASDSVFFNMFNSIVFEAYKTDKFVENIPNGIFVENTLELAENDKIINLNEVKTIYLSLFEIEKDRQVKEKLFWLLEYVNSQLNKCESRFGKVFPDN